MSKPRSIFEEVGGEKQDQEAPKGGLIDAGRGGERGPIARWLSVLFAMVVIMIAVGGLTRLTDSGLSITEWNVVKGAVPPMNATDWDAEFEKYKTIPEYQLQNKGMSLSEFKRIYWWEWGHRQLGRLIGLVWALGFVWFLVRRQIPTGWTQRLIIIGGLGGLQGAVGWWMVSSGLTGRMLDVASYRLAIHLGLAFFILGVIVWAIWQLRRKEMDLFQARRSRDVALGRIAVILLVLVGAQIILGALVAGIDAGRGYIDWPMMGGEFLPSESFDYDPKWTNFFENPALVQFNHRMLGYLVFGFAIFAWWSSRKAAQARTRHAFDWMLVSVFGQVVLGIGTVIYAAPLHLALVHQLGAVIVMVLTLNTWFQTVYPTSDRLQRGIKT